MYDRYIDERVFRRLKSRVAQLWYSTSDEDPEDIMDAIQDALKDGQISGTQYDDLVGELSELGYDI